MDKTSSPSLHVSRIALGFEWRVLFERLTFTLKKGEALVLKDRNGAGKTTLLKGIAGLKPLLAGEVRLNGMLRKDDPLGFSGRLVYVGHEDGLALELTAIEAISLWARSRGLAFSSSQLEASFDLLGMRSVMGEPLRLLSAGQRRRVAMVRLALIVESEASSTIPLWLLDEPTASMDSEASAQLAELITRHLQAGGFAIISEHSDLPIKARVTTLANLEAKSA